MSFTVCATVESASQVLVDGLLVEVDSSSSLRGVLLRLTASASEYDCDSVSVKCSSSEKGHRYEATLDNTVEQIMESISSSQ